MGLGLLQGTARGCTFGGPHWTVNLEQNHLLPFECLGSKGSVVGDLDLCQDVAKGASVLRHNLATAGGGPKSIAATFGN